MATNMQLQLNSDLLSDTISVTTDMQPACMKAGTSADDLDQLRMGYVEIATGTNFDLFNADNGLNKDKGNKVYICNNSTDETYYVIITIDATVVGRLYANDWMFIPWEANADTNDLKYAASVSTGMVLEHMIISE